MKNSDRARCGMISSAQVLSGERGRERGRERRVIDEGSTRSCSRDILNKSRLCVRRCMWMGGTKKRRTFISALSQLPVYEGKEGEGRKKKKEKKNHHEGNTTTRTQP